MVTKKQLIYQYSFGVSAGLTAMSAGAWLAWPSSVIKTLEKGVMTSSEVGTMVALMDFGNMLSPIPSAYLVNIIGRKKTLLICFLVNLFASLSVLVYETPVLIDIARLFAGIGKGISFAVVPIYLAEIANNQIRGALSTMFIGFLNFGMLYSFVIGPFTSYTIFNLAILIIPVLFGMSFWFFPESPYYLILKNKEAKALKSLEKYRAENDARVNEEMTEMTKRVNDDMKNKARFTELFKTKGNVRALIIISALAFFQRSSGISPTLAYSTKIMPENGGGMPVASYMIAFSLLLVIANFAVLPLVDTLGRKPLLLISSGSTGITTSIVGIYYACRHYGMDVSAYNWVTYAGLILFSITYSIGIGFLPSTLVGELFPTNVKSYAASISAIILAGVSCAVNKVFEVVHTNEVGVHFMYGYFAVTSFACFFFVYFYLFETKGKTFTEIQNILSKEEQPLLTQVKSEDEKKLRQDAPSGSIPLKNK